MHSNDCLVTCPSKFYSDIDICQACVAPCLTCSSDIICLSCGINFFLYGSNCVASCDPGMVIINTNECKFCSSSCKTCMTSNLNYCTSCYTTTYLYNGACDLSCPIKFF